MKIIDYWFQDKICFYDSTKFRFQDRYDSVLWKTQLLPEWKEYFVDALAIYAIADSTCINLSLIKNFRLME